MFGASALATILFSNNSKDYSDNFNRLQNSVDSINSKMDMLVNITTFMKARMCLTEFNTKLLGKPKVNKDTTIEDIMANAKEGFEKLLDAAVADSNNFSEARKIFNDTYGNKEWVKEKFGALIEDVKLFISTYINNKKAIIDYVGVSWQQEHIEFELHNISKIHWYKKRKLQEKLNLLEKSNKQLHDNLITSISQSYNNAEIMLKKFIDLQCNINYETCYLIPGGILSKEECDHISEVKSMRILTEYANK